MHERLQILVKKTLRLILQALRGLSLLYFLTFSFLLIADDFTLFCGEI